MFIYIHPPNIFYLILSRLNINTNCSSPRRTTAKCEYLRASGSAEPKCLNVGSREMDEPSGEVSSGAP